jgi:hypothetical protein
LAGYQEAVTAPLAREDDDVELDEEEEAGEEYDSEQRMRHRVQRLRSVEKVGLEQSASFCIG